MGCKHLVGRTHLNKQHLHSPIQRLTSGSCSIMNRRVRKRTMGILRDGIKGGGCLRLLIMVVMVVCGPSVCTEYLRCFHSKLLSLLASLSHLPLQASRVVCLHTHTHTHTLTRAFWSSGCHLWHWWWVSSSPWQAFLPRSVSCDYWWVETCQSRRLVKVWGRVGRKGRLGWATK